MHGDEFYNHMLIINYFFPVFIEHPLEVRVSGAHHQKSRADFHVVGAGDWYPGL